MKGGSDSRLEECKNLLKSDGREVSEIECHLHYAKTDYSVSLCFHFHPLKYSVTYSE